MDRSNHDYEVMTDEALAALVNQGNRQAADALAYRHYEFIFGFIRSFRIQETDAQDLTQESICRTLEKLKRGVVVRTNYKAFLTYTARGVVSPFLRSPGRHIVPLDASEVILNQNDSSLNTILDDVCADETRNEQSVLLRSALQRLKHWDRSLLIARHVHKHSVPDLMLMGHYRSEAAVYQALHRALDRLTVALEAESSQALATEASAHPDDASTPRTVLSLLRDRKADVQRGLQKLKGRRPRTAPKPRILKTSNPISSPIETLKNAFVQVALDGPAAFIALDPHSALPRETNPPNSVSPSQPPPEEHMRPDSHTEATPQDHAPSSATSDADAPVAPDAHDVSYTDQKGVPDDD